MNLNFKKIIGYFKNAGGYLYPSVDLRDCGQRKAIIGTKAETLFRIKSYAKKSHISKMLSFTVTRWKEEEDKILEEIINYFEGKKNNCA